VALIAIHAVVHVAAHTLVLRIGVPFGVAVGALEDAIVAGIGVACSAHAVRAPVILIEPGVIEDRTRPAGG